MNQTEVILEHMRRYGSITPAEAYDSYGIMRLGARIWDLKHDGVGIIAEREDGLNRLGKRCHWNKYSLRRDRI